MKTKNVITIILGLLFVWICYYWGMPTFKYGFIGIPVITLLVGIGIMALDFIGDTEPTGQWKIGLTISLIGVLFAIILPIGSSRYFVHQDLKNQIGEIKERTFSTDINPINPKDIIIIDYEVARTLADKKLVDNNSSLGSQVEIGNFTLQKVQSKFYYVAPLNHTSHWKYRKNKKGTPGYMIVNANNDKDVRLVSEVAGVKIMLQYQKGASWGRNLARHLYTNGYRNVGLTDYSFEIDDNYMPWYVVTKYEKTIGYTGNEAVGVVLVNPMNGEITEYPIEDAPKWIDRIQPKDFIITQINNWGHYVEGLWNWSDKNKKKLSDGVQLVYGEDGNCYLYSGLTSVGRDNASMGFVMVNSRTKETTFYKSTGAIESAIKRSAEDKFPEKGYRATYPRPYNINGTWTYVMALKDSQGAIKKVAMVNYERFQIVGMGDNMNISDALRNYKSALNGSGNIIVLDGNNDYITVGGKIVRLNCLYNDNINYFYFMLDTIPDKLFVSTSATSNELYLTKIGDKIEIKITETNEAEVFVDFFDNLNITYTKSENQNSVEKDAEKVDKRIDGEKLDNRVRVILEDLSEDEKKALLKNSK